MSDMFARLPADNATDALVELFDGLFAAAPDATRLVAGGDEPLYLPADGRGGCHRIIFRADYFASALHEVAHWCIAGRRRRQRVDYGYWYQPDGRTPEQQRAFERVEARPQALEWIFSRAANTPFRISVDNLDGEAFDPFPFRLAVWQAVQDYCRDGLGGRAERFHRALRERFGGNARLDGARFRLADLD